MKKEHRSQNPQDEVLKIKLGRKTGKHELLEFNNSPNLVIIVVIYGFTALC
jgi:hypothetical protein